LATGVVGVIYGLHFDCSFASRRRAGPITASWVPEDRSGEQRRDWKPQPEIRLGGATQVAQDLRKFFSPPCTRPKLPRHHDTTKPQGRQQSFKFRGNSELGCIPVRSARRDTILESEGGQRRKPSSLPSPNPLPNPSIIGQREIPSRRIGRASSGPSGPQGGPPAPAAPHRHTEAAATAPAAPSPSRRRPMSPPWRRRYAAASAGACLRS
jgi:hypothetical protein